MNKKQFAAAIAERTMLTKEACIKMLDAFGDVVLELMKQDGTITIPDIVKIKLVEKAARPERQMYSPIRKETVTVLAKPATKRIVCKPMKALRDGLGAR